MSNFFDQAYLEWLEAKIVEIWKKKVSDCKKIFETKPIYSKSHNKAVRELYNLASTIKQYEEYPTSNIINGGICTVAKTIMPIALKLEEPEMAEEYLSILTNKELIGEDYYKAVSSDAKKSALNILALYGTGSRTEEKKENADQLAVDILSGYYGEDLAKNLSQKDMDNAYNGFIKSSDKIKI